MAAQETLTIALNKIDVALLSVDARDSSSSDFQDQTIQLVTSQLSRLGGQADVGVLDGVVTASWRPSCPWAEQLERLVDIVNKGERAEAMLLSLLLLSSHPDEPVLHYNLGMALSDAGHHDEAENHLRLLLKKEPRHANGHVALGVLLVRQRRTREAVDELRRAIDLNPKSPWAYRNLGAALMQLGDESAAVTAFESAIQFGPTDPMAWCGLAEAYRMAGREQEADAAYQRAIDLDEFGGIGERARSGRHGLAEQFFRSACGDIERPDAVMYLVGALERFDRMTPEQVQQVGFEIAMLGTKGIDINNPDHKYYLRSLSGEFTGLHLVSLMYAAFQQISPGQALGFDLAREYDTARELHNVGLGKAS